jgi:hypothetical protein
VQRDTFSLRWLLAAAGLVLLNNFLLNRGYGLLPHLIPPSQWNWQGKLLALARHPGDRLAASLRLEALRPDPCPGGGQPEERSLETIRATPGL